MRNSRKFILALSLVALLASAAFAYQVQITPPFAFVMPDSSKQFTAVLRNHMGQIVPGLTWTWTLTPTTLGTLSNTGLFTAGSDTGHGIIHAMTTYQSHQYTGTAYVHVVLSLPPPPPPPPPPPGLHVQICPMGATVAPGGTQQFMATLRSMWGPPIPNLTWTWTVTPPALGTITNMGLFTAGSDTGSGWVHATTTYHDSTYHGQAMVRVLVPPPPPPPPPLHVQICPMGATVAPGGTRQFTATLRSMWGPPIPNLTWTWSVDPTTLGTITNMGLFTAGPDTGSGWVRATTTYQDSTYTGQAMVRVMPPPPPPPPPPLHVYICPPFAWVHPDSSRQFIATLRSMWGPPIPNLTWTWAVDPPALGTITPMGLFTAGPDTGHGFVRATTTYQDSTYTGQAAVHVIIGWPPPPPPPPPPPGGQIQGIVTHQVTGNPIPGAHVKAIKLGSPYQRMSFSDSLGNYNCNGLPNGEYVVQAMKMGFMPEYYNNVPNFQQATHITILNANIVTGINFTLAPWQDDQLSGYGENEWYADVTAPTEFQLQGASPNPFNPTTTISFGLPEASQVALKVYDLQGRLVASLVNGWRDAGYHQVTFDGSSHGTGVYIYTLTAGRNVATGKMVLMK